MLTHGDRRQAALQKAHRFVEPLRQYRDERSQEDDVSHHRDDDRKRADEGAGVVAEIARIRQSQESPPDGVPDVDELIREEPCAKSSQQCDGDDYAGDEEQPRANAALNPSLEKKLEAILKREIRHVINHRESARSMGPRFTARAEDAIYHASKLASSNPREDRFRNVALTAGSLDRLLRYGCVHPLRRCDQTNREKSTWRPSSD